MCRLKWPFNLVRLVCGMWFCVFGVYMLLVAHCLLHIYSLFVRIETTVCCSWTKNWTKNKLDMNENAITIIITTYWLALLFVVRCPLTTTWWWNEQIKIDSSENTIYKHTLTLCVVNYVVLQCLSILRP